MSTREVAILIWFILIITSGFIFSLSIRRSIFKVIKAIFHFLVSVPMRFFYLYELLILITLVIYIAKYHILSYWFIKDYLKDTTILIFPLLGEVQFNNNFIVIFKNKLKSMIVLSTFTAFLISDYTFSFIVEFIVILPLFFILLTFSEVARSRPEFENISYFLDLFLFFLVFIMLLRNLYMFIMYRDMFTLSFWISYNLTIIIFLIHLPFLFFWRKLLILELQIQKFQYKGFFAYVCYLIRCIKEHNKMLMIRDSIKPKIDWHTVHADIKSGLSGMGYRIYIKDQIYWTDFQILLLTYYFQFMVCPTYVYGKTPIFFPNRIMIIHNNNLIAIWENPKLADDCKLSNLYASKTIAKTGIRIIR